MNDERTRLRGSIPNWVIGQLDDWVERGVYPPSIFIQRILHNDLIGTFMQADIKEMMELPDIIAYVYNHVPHECWGTAEKLQKWTPERSRIDETEGS